MLDQMQFCVEKQVELEEKTNFYLELLHLLLKQKELSEGISAFLQFSSYQ